MAWLKTLNISKRRLSAMLSVIFVSFSTPTSVLIASRPVEEELLGAAGHATNFVAAAEAAGKG